MVGAFPTLLPREERRMSTNKLLGLRIDVETRSRENVKVGPYRYSEDPDFAILVISYSPMFERPDGSIANGAVKRIDPHNPSKKFVSMLSDTRFQKHAFNANFERITLSRWLGMKTGEYLDPEGWHCSAIRANVNGVFGSLDEVSKALKTPIGKDTEGKRLIKLFSEPNKKSGEFHEYLNPFCWCGVNHQEDFERFEQYCDQDVLTEMAVARSLPDPPNEVQYEYELDQRINDRGVRHFAALSKQAVIQVEAEKNRLMEELKNLTQLDNPNSIQQLQGWLKEQDYPMASLDAAHRDAALKDPLVPPQVEKALVLKGAASLSSVQKHKKALETRSNDGRIRGTLRFYGAHTGREAGRSIQPQNLPRYEASNADRKRLLYGTAGADAPTIAKGTVRSSLVPAKGHTFVTADYTAIEACVLAGLAGEEWAKREFSHGNAEIYEATAAAMFNIDKQALVQALRKCGKCGACPDCTIRNQGKVSDLALGYEGGAGALVAMGAESAGIDCGNYSELHAEWVEEGSPGKFHFWRQDEHDYPELLRLRDVYRASSPATVRFWKQCAMAWDAAALHGRDVPFGDGGILRMMRDGRHNRLILPSGRSIWYRYARSHFDPDRPKRVDRRTFIGKGTGVGHVRTDTHGGKLTENVTQAVARDVLFNLIKQIEAKTAQGWPGRIVLHVHDEVLIETPKSQADFILKDVLAMMRIPPAWGPFIHPRGAGFISSRYRK